MNLWRQPVQRWPLPVHALLAMALLAGLALALMQWKSHQHAAGLKTGEELKALQNRVEALRGQAPRTVDTNFSHKLPSVTRSHDVVHDISGFAQSGAVQIASLVVEPRGATPAELGRVLFSVAATAEYRAAKTWLAQLLARHPSLGVQSMALRALPGEPARVEARLSLVLFVKD